MIFARPTDTIKEALCDSTCGIILLVSGLGGIGDMTAPIPPKWIADRGAVLIGASVTMVEDGTAGRIFVNGQLCWVWDAGQASLRRLAAAHLVHIGAARVNEVAAGFGVTPESVRRWLVSVRDRGVESLSPVRKGPKGPTVLTGGKTAEIRRLRAAGASLRAAAAAVGVSPDTVRRALTSQEPVSPGPPAHFDGTLAGPPEPVVPVPVVQTGAAGEGAAALAGLPERSAPEFASAARVPWAGLFLALPALERTGLLPSLKATFEPLHGGRYGLESVALDAVLRALAGETRAGGDASIDPAALARVLGLDRAPEPEDLHRTFELMAKSGKAADLLAALATHHLHGPRADDASGNAEDGDLTAVLYVDGHVHAYQGRKGIRKVDSTRLNFPIPAGEETWVSDAHGYPVLVVMAEPGAVLTGELRDLLPELRSIVGDSRRVLVNFDRAGWPPAFFKHMEDTGFDVLTWLKGNAPDLPEDNLADVTHVDSHGQTRVWKAADTAVHLNLTTTGAAFRMRQISRTVPAPAGKTRQIHILTTDTRMPAGEVIYLMGSRWRQENYFSYARIHFDQDPYDPYAGPEDNTERTVANPEKRKAFHRVVAARSHYTHVLAEADDATGAPARGAGKITDTVLDSVNAALLAAEAALDQAEAAYKMTPARLSLAKLSSDQHAHATQMELITHALRMAAYNTASTLAREIRTNTGYVRGIQEAHTLARQVLSRSGDIDTSDPRYLTVRLDPPRTPQVAETIGELCQRLTATRTRYPGTALILRFEIKGSRLTRHPKYHLPGVIPNQR